jgi:hypothetical protein
METTVCPPLQPVRLLKSSIDSPGRGRSTNCSLRIFSCSFDDRVQQHLRAGWTAGHIHVDRYNVVDALHNRVVVEHSAAGRADPHSDNPFWLEPAPLSHQDTASPESCPPRSLLRRPGLRPWTSELLRHGREPLWQRGCCQQPHISSPTKPSQVRRRLRRHPDGSYGQPQGALGGRTGHRGYAEPRPSKGDEGPRLCELPEERCWSEHSCYGFYEVSWRPTTR